MLREFITGNRHMAVVAVRGLRSIDNDISGLLIEVKLQELLKLNAE